MNGYAEADDRTAAITRVESDLDLKPYYDILIEYDWPYPDHLEWVATENKEDILEWCEGVRADEAQMGPAFADEEA